MTASCRIVRPSLLLLQIVSLSLLAAGCREQADQTVGLAETTTMKLGNKTFKLEIAATERARQYGLMNRKSMPQDHGMVFVFRTEEKRAFYMKHTLIPLDIVYVNGEGKVVSIVRMPAEAKKADGDWENFSSEAPIRYAIELNAGVAAASDIHVGDVLQIPSEVRAPGNLE